MQSVQVQNVGILLSKKGYNSEGAEVLLKTFVKYKKHRKWHQMIKWNSYQADLIRNFNSGM